MCNIVTFNLFLIHLVILNNFVHNFINFNFINHIRYKTPALKIITIIIKTIYEN